MNKLEALELELSDAKNKLERLEDEAHEVECRISKARDEIKAIKTKMETEALPTELYNAGFRLIEDNHHICLIDSTGEEVREFPYAPSLGELFDVAESLKVSS
jgi:predicted  nucleic acid-binding Zn-ribbon protein